jgi:hypothetical protein
MFPTVLGAGNPRGNRLLRPLRLCVQAWASAVSTNCPGAETFRFVSGRRARNAKCHIRNHLRRSRLRRSFTRRL